MLKIFIITLANNARDCQVIIYDLETNVTGLYKISELRKEKYDPETKQCNNTESKLYRVS